MDRMFESDYGYGGHCPFHGNGDEVCCEAWKSYDDERDDDDSGIDEQGNPIL